MFFFSRFFKKKKKQNHLLEIPNNKAWNLKSLWNSNNTNENLLSTLEETLLTSDVSVKTTMDILSHLHSYKSKGDLLPILKEYIFSLVLNQKLVLEDNNLNILFIFGVNGVGKTTSVAKLAYYLKQQEQDVLLAAADTYRAAAVDQLKTWSSRVDIPLVFHEGKSKPAAVVYDALDSALARKKSVLIIDTAGRFHNREDLLAELAKLQRIIKEKSPSAKVQNLLVVDSTTGQNALEQAKNFHHSVGISGIILSKWDSSGKGGIVLNLSAELNLPVYFVGLGEGLEDIEPFDKNKFITHLLRD